MKSCLIAVALALGVIALAPSVPVSARRMALPGSSCGGSTTDNFTRADAATLGANWTNWGSDPSTQRLGIVSNKASPGAAMQFGGSYWTADSFTNNQCAKATVASAPSGAAYAGVLVRATGTGASDFKAYGLLCNDSLIRIEKFNNSITTPSTLATLTGTCANTDVMMLQATGTTLEGFKNGSSAGSTTDASFSSGSAGIYVYANTAGMTFSAATVDNMASAFTYPAAIINSPIRGGGVIR